MNLELGLFYYDTHTVFPCVVIKSLTSERVLVRVWADSGDRTETAVRSDGPGEGVFVLG
mgnify:CR=1 FL=1